MNNPSPLASMFPALFTHRWSTLALLGVSSGLSALAFVAGRQLAARPVLFSRLTVACVQPAPTPAVPPAGSANADAPPAVPPAAGLPDLDASWERWSNAPRTPATEQHMAAALETLAGHDPQRAMTLALEEGNVRLRQNLRAATLRGWAAQSPDDAAAWALALPDGERQISLEAVFAGAVLRPAEATRLGQRLCAENPEMAGDCGQFLISALTNAGDYETAARFAAGDQSVHHAAWLQATFFQWASHQPQPASLAFAALEDPAQRSAAFQGMILGWAMANPATLATYAAQLPPGENRAEALGQALPQWIRRDPLLASEWIIQQAPNPDLDNGAAAVATLPHLVGERPEIAVGWAESIVEPVLRANTLRTVALQWGRQDPAALRQFLSATPGLSPEDRTALLEGLNPPPDA